MFYLQFLYVGLNNFLIDYSAQFSHSNLHQFPNTKALIVTDGIRIISMCPKRRLMVSDLWFVLSSIFFASHLYSTYSNLK